MLLSRTTLFWDMNLRARSFKWDRMSRTSKWAIESPLSRVYHVWNVACALMGDTIFAQMSCTCSLSLLSPVANFVDWRAEVQVLGNTAFQRHHAPLRCPPSALSLPHARYDVLRRGSTHRAPIRRLSRRSPRSSIPWSTGHYSRRGPHWSFHGFMCESGRR